MRRVGERRPDLRRPGVVVFTSHLLSAFTGLLFTLMVTRELGTEFGVWQNIGDLVFYFTALENIVPFWAKRFVARGFEGSGRTGLACSLALGTSIAAIYGLAVPYLMALMGVGGSFWLPYALVAIQIFEIYVLRGLGATLHPRRPEAVGYAIMVKEFTKLAAAFFLVLQYGLGLLGAVCSVLLAHAAQVGFSFLMAKPFLTGRFNSAYAKEWLKGSFVPIYSFVGRRMYTIVLFILFATAGEVARGYYGAAQVIGMMIFNTSFLAYALYPRLLSESGGSSSSSPASRDIETALKLVLMFSIPMTVGAIVLSDLLLAVLNVAFKPAWPVLIVLAPYYALQSLSTVFWSVVVGSERVDAQARIPVRRLVRTRLFALYTVPYICNSAMIPLALWLIPAAPDALEASLRTAFLFVAYSIALTGATYSLARRSMSFSFPLGSTAKYALAAAAMAIPLVLLPHEPLRIYWALTLVAIGTSIYVGVLLALDEETRGLLRELLRALSTRNRPR